MSRKAAYIDFSAITLVETINHLSVLN